MKQKKVLIIDDEPLVRRSLRRVFESQNWQTYEASNGTEGLQVWQEKHPDLVFLDVLMPGLSGPEVLKEISSDLKNQTKIIMISAYTGDYNLETAQNLGAHLFLPKPFEDIFKIYETSAKLVT